MLEELEILVDRYGLACVLHALAEISSLKAEHLKENWQDRVLAKIWDKSSSQLHSTACRIEKNSPYI